MNVSVEIDSLPENQIIYLIDSIRNHPELFDRKYIFRRYARQVHEAYDAVGNEFKNKFGIQISSQCLKEWWKDTRREYKKIHVNGEEFNDLIIYNHCSFLDPHITSAERLCSKLDGLNRRAKALRRSIRKLDVEVKKFKKSVGVSEL